MVRIWAVSLAGKKSRRWLGGVVEKVRLDVGVVGERRRPMVEEDEGQMVEEDRRGATARVSWAACLGAQSLVVARVVNMERVE